MSKTGQLQQADVYQFVGIRGPFDFYRCVDCNTEFIANSMQQPRCNGYAIELCPWCRPDSAPWKDGRGA